MKKFSIFNFYHKDTSSLRRASQFSIVSQKGFSVLEVLLASVIFVTFASAAIVAVLGAFTANRLGQENSIATQFATEGLEAVRSIRNQGFNNLDNSSVATSATGANCVTGSGVQLTGGVWALKATGTSDALSSDSRFSRIVTICDAQRVATVSSNLSSSGTVYQNVKKVTSTVTWNFTPQHQSSVSLITYLSNWRTAKGGMLFYADQTTAANNINYKIFSANPNITSNTWGASGTLSNGVSTDAVQDIRVYASATRNEKIVIARHSSSTTTKIYASVWDGASSTWVNQTLLTSWAASSVNDLLNFDGGYQVNGNFVAVYSNNSTNPQTSTWNGSSWTAGANLFTTALAGTPQWIEVNARSGSNDIMASILDSASDVTTTFYNGVSWTRNGTTDIHSTAALLTTKHMIDFTWSPADSTVGSLLFSSKTGSNDKAIHTQTVKVTTGAPDTYTWSAAATGSQTNNAGGMSITGRGTEPTAGRPEFMACDKDAATTPTIVCYRVTSSASPGSTAPTVSASTTVAAATDTGTQRSFDVSYQASTGDTALLVYSDNTNVPKFKKFVGGVTNAWDGSATAISMGAFAPGIFKTVRLNNQDAGDDMSALMADANLTVYSIFWNASGPAMYSTPASMAIQQEGIKGPTGGTANRWFDFAWDKF